MTNTYKAQLVPMETNRIMPKEAIITYPDGTVTTSHDAYVDGWQAQRLVITSDEKISKGDWYMYESPFMIQKCAVYPIFPDKAIKTIASYPTIPNALQIDLSDIRRWIESGCPDSVELEVNYTNICESMKGGIYGFSPLLTNNTVKMVWGEQDKAQPIAGVDADILTEAFKRYAVSEDWRNVWIDGVAYGQAHPATDWNALRDKFFKDAPLFNIDKEIAKRIADYFKNELTK